MHFVSRSLVLVGIDMCGEFRVSEESHDGIPVTLQGSKQCLHPMRRRLCWMTKNANSWKPWLVPIRLRRRSPVEPELCCVRRMKRLRAICRLPWNSVAPETPSGSGEGGWSAPSGMRPRACLSLYYTSRYEKQFFQSVVLKGHPAIAQRFIAGKEGK